MTKVVAICCIHLQRLQTINWARSRNHLFTRTFNWTIFHWKLSFFSFNWNQNHLPYHLQYFVAQTVNCICDVAQHCFPLKLLDNVLSAVEKHAFVACANIYSEMKMKIYGLLRLWGATESPRVKSLTLINCHSFSLLVLCLRNCICFLSL